MQKIITLSFLVFFLATASYPVLARTIHVPAEFAKIEQAVLRAAENDTILVGPGEYILDYGNILIEQDQLTLKSTDGPEKTIIKGRADNPVISLSEGSRVFIEGFTITSFHDDEFISVRGGGIFCASLSIPVIMNNIIKDNRAIFGGAIFCANRSNPKIRNNKIIGNYASTSGGGIFSNRATPDIYSNRFENNRASTSGGGIFINRDTAIIRGNIFWKNSSRSGGAIGAERSSTAIINNTMVANSAEFGGGIMVDGGPVRMANLILWQNDDDLYYTGYSPFSRPAFSDISDGDFRGVNGNSMVDPLFADMENGNFVLSENSPCIDAGNPEPMFFDTNGSKNDMGAYGGPKPYSE